MASHLITTDFLLLPIDHRQVNNLLNLLYKLINL